MVLERERSATWLSIGGASVGVVAGILQASIGADMPEWSGNKNNPVALGILTMILSLIALASGIALARHSPSTPRRLTIAFGLLLPGLICFTTVGMLWYLPGGLLLAATVLVLGSGDAVETRRFVSTQWIAGLVSALGLLQILLALGTGAAGIAAIGIVGGIAVVVAPWIPRRSVRIALLVAGAVPFALLTWWSVASPLLALLTLGLGAIVVRSPGFRAVRDHELDAADA